MAPAPEMAAPAAATALAAAAAAVYPLPAVTPNRFSLKNNMMSGVTLPGLARLLWRHGDAVDWLAYGHRVLFLGVMATLNSLLGLLDQLLYGHAIAAQPLHAEPLIILGHPRTGTTHIHNLLSLDPTFAFARTLHAGFPAAFLVLERFKWLLAPLVDPVRPMDAMPLSLDTPAEDEIAVSALTGAVSAYLPLLFPRDRDRFDAFYTFGEGASPADFRLWRDSWMWFLKKVTLRWGGTRPLLIKSPVHTARVALLLRLFPRARFVYVHRDPLVTFQSSAHLADKYYPFCYLQRPTDAAVTDFILDQFDLLHSTYMADRPLIPPGRLVEVRFAELDADPLGALRRIYDGLGLPGFEAMRPAFERYCGGLELTGFKKNAHRPLSRQLRQRVRQRWGNFYRGFGYAELLAAEEREDREAAQAEAQRDA